MGKLWDYDAPSVDFWKEVYRVLKPGGYILSFGGTRTYHRMVVNMEADAKKTAGADTEYTRMLTELAKNRNRLQSNEHRRGCSKNKDVG